jgi:hypothetical protein
VEQRGTLREKTACGERGLRRESADPHLHLVDPALAAQQCSRDDAIER